MPHGCWLRAEISQHGHGDFHFTATEVAMPNINARLVGLELYFEDLTAAKRFYEGTLGLILSGEQSGHHAQFNAGAAFLCLEKKGWKTIPRATRQ